MKVTVLTLGCKVNQYESSSIEGALRSTGCEVVDLEDSPELCIINTCSVTAKSDYQSRQLIRRAQRAGARVIVTGCYSELNKDSVLLLPGVADVVPNEGKSEFISKLAGKGARLEPLSYEGKRKRLTIKVQDGCNSSCSYCLIPKARGRSRSVLPIDVIAEVKRGAQAGYREIVLTGIHLGQYGRDIGHSLKSLISAIINETDIQRVRLSSIEITEIDDELVNLFSSGRICGHLHVPLQSGSDKILKSMNRNYDTEFFRERVNGIADAISGINLGTDIIVGFPGEAEEDFLNTLSYVESLPISYIHVFPFSARPGTLAAQMGDRVDDAEKARRCRLLRGLSDRKKQAYTLSQVGKTLDVLMEETSLEAGCLGTSGNYLKIRAVHNPDIVGDIVPVRVLGMSGNMLGGELSF